MLHDVIPLLISLIMNTFTDERKLVQLLGKVPRIMLLILKTNDLSMYLSHSSSFLEVAC